MTNLLDVGLLCDEFEESLPVHPSREKAMSSLIDKLEKEGRLQETVETIPEDSDGLRLEIKQAIANRWTLRQISSREFSYTDIPLKTPTPISIDEKFYDVKNIRDASTLSHKHIGVFYLATIGKGHKSVLIYISGSHTLPLGENHLCLRRMNPTDAEKIFAFLDNHGTETLANFDSPRRSRIWKASPKESSFPGVYRGEFAQATNFIPLSEVLAGSIYEIVPAIQHDFVLHAAKSKNLRQLLEDYFEGQYTHDPELVQIVRTNLITYGNSCLPRFEKYQPHTLIITSTKAGKSALLTKLCPDLKFDKASASNLLGFAGGKKSEVHEGTINNHYGPACLDDLADNFGAGMADNLTTLIEQGYVTIALGCQRLNTRYSGQVNITTNTKGEHLDSRYLAIQLMQIIDKLSNSPERIGSRIGALVIADTWTPASGHLTLSNKDMAINEEIVRFVCSMISGQCPQLLDSPEIISFIESEDKDYSSSIHGMISKSSLPTNAKHLWKSFTRGYKHQKGFAFKQALIEYFCAYPADLEELISNPAFIIPSSKLMPLAYEAWADTKKLQLQTLARFIEGAPKFEYLYNNLPEYIKALLPAVDKFLEAHPDTEPSRLILFEELNNFVDKDHPTYSSAGRISNKLPKNLTSINRQLEDFHIEIIPMDGHYTVKTNHAFREIFTNVSV